ncbi:uncharacterized protein LOC108732920 isoform X2 [Agrilus planipennis]|uniref:Uncharacterized protein LOC108732920 isoform X2 n=1 Tax=Agrilus planipennis TaxID=224129 RepID=A0A1W4WG38_AGRPL|nr:uncharacterized protein LOC108732920 isoform X2 [Agrilus planipennis]
MFTLKTYNGAIFTPVTIEVIDISPCTDLGFRKQLLLNFEVGVSSLLSDSDVDPVRIINGNISLASPVDTTHRISLRTLRLENAKWIPDKTYLHNEFLCTIIDQLANGATSNDAIDVIRTTPATTKTSCPLPTGTYEINGFPATLRNIYGYPLDAIGRGIFRVEIMEGNNIPSCFDVLTESAFGLLNK